MTSVDLLLEFQISLTEWMDKYRYLCVCQVDDGKVGCYHAPEEQNVERFISVGFYLQDFHRRYPDLITYPWYQKSIQIFQTGNPKGPRDCMAVVESILCYLRSFM